MNIFAVLLNSVVTWHGRAWWVADVHDSRITLQCRENGESIRETVDPHRMVAEFEAGRMKWAQVNINHRMIGI